MKQAAGKMGSGSEPVSSAVNWRDRESGLIFWEPGWYVREKLNLPKNRAHLAWREFRRLADWI